MKQILAAHQACFLPSIVFFRKLLVSDVFVLGDDYQYTTNHEINRTRIKSAAGAIWLTVPVLTKGRRGQQIADVRINNEFSWAARHIRTISVNYCYAAFYEQFCDEIFSIYSKSWTHLIELNLCFIAYLAETLSISTRVVRSSELNLQGKANARLFDMLGKTECCTYLADSGFAGYLKRDEFRRNGFDLLFVDKLQSEKRYYQQFGHFIPGLSAIDLLFNEGEEAKSFLNSEQVIIGHSGT